MKYIIWGAGRRGKWAIQFLGEEKVLAFIDGNSDRIGQNFCGKKIISWETAQKIYKDYIVIISSLEGSEEIQVYLESEHFYRFFKLDDLPMNLPCDERDEFSVVLSYDKQKKYGFLETNLFSIYLYEKMRETGTVVNIALQNGIYPDLEQLLKENIRFSAIEKVITESDEIIISNEDKQSVGQVKYVMAEDFVMENMLPTRKELLKFKNVHSGKRCFIVATGPSLRVEDLDKLHQNGDICISMNRIFNIFDRTQWRPDYYMVGDTEMIEDMSKEIADLKLQHKFVANEPKSYWNNHAREDSIPYKILLRGFIEKMPYFSECIESGISHGATVTYLCIHLAVYLGFAEIYLLGVDFNYTKNVYDPQNHFEGCDTPQNRIRLNTVYPERTLLAYQAANKYCKEHEIKICNATRGGKLEEFERVNFDSLF